MELLTSASLGHFVLMLLALFVGLSIVEGIIMHFFRLASLRRCLGQSIAINLISTVVGLGLVFIIRLTAFSDLRFDNEASHIPFWVSTWLVIVIIESLTLKAVNKPASWEKAFTVSMTMNAVTFLGLYAMAL
jgi:hypothetical protein